MRVLVVGGGAIGGITAAQLDADVTVLDANAAHVAALRDPGLVINDEAPVPVDAVDSVDELEGEFDFALIAVKSPLHHVALPPLVERGGIGAFVLARQRPDPGPHRGDRRRGQPARLPGRVGRLQRRPRRADPRLARRLRGRRARRHDHAIARARSRTRWSRSATTRVTDNVRGMIWTKLLVNSTFTGLSAVSGLRYGGVAEQGRDAVFALWKEGVPSPTRRASSSVRSTTSTRTRSTRPGSRR